MEPTRRPRVLVADDNADNRRVVGRLLGRHDVDATVVGGGHEALARLAAEPFDVLFLDGMMPGLDGPATAREIRRREAAAGVPRIAIVALTASSGPDDLARMLEAGMDDLVVKPIGAGALERALDRWLPEPGRRTTMIPAIEGVAVDAEATDPRVDPSAFGRLAAIGDVELADRLVGVFLSDADGRAAQVDAAIGARDAAGARRALAAIERIGVLVGATGPVRTGARARRPARRAWRNRRSRLGRPDRTDRPGTARRGDEGTPAGGRGDPRLARARRQGSRRAATTSSRNDVSMTSTPAMTSAMMNGSG